MTRSFRFAKTAIWLFALALPGNCTSVIYKVDGNRVFIAADNREGRKTVKQETSNDKACKIHLIGRTVLAVAGMHSHYHGPVSGNSLDWDAFSVAQSAYKTVGEHDLDRLALEWGGLLSRQIAGFLDLDPQSKSEMLGSSSSALVIAGVFAHSLFGMPKVAVENVQILKTGMYANPPYRPQLGVEDSTNVTSQELIHGKTERARAAKRRWDLESKKYPADQLSWRHIQFLIWETGAFDDMVSPTSDVVEILPSGEVVWLSKSRCQ